MNKTETNEIGRFYTKPAGTVQEVVLKKHRLLKLFYRPKTSDSKMLKEGFDDYPEVNCENKVVMDCGANIGGFILKACKTGAKSVHAFEPEEFNLEVLKKNVNILLQDFPNTNIIVHDQALCNSDDKTLTFNLNDSSNSACSGSLVKTRKSFEVVVKATNFWEEVDRIRPELIKMDVEGAEYDLLDRSFPDYVKEVAFELHGFKSTMRQKMFALIHAYKLRYEEWEIVSEKIVMVFNEPKLALLHIRRK